MADEPSTLPIDADGSVALPTEDVLTGRGFITGKSGSGKSNSASVIIEELLDRGYPVCIIDIEGEYYGLKEQYELLHVGADDEADVVVTPDHAERLAELTLTERVPLIVDVSGFIDEEERNGMVESIGRAFYRAEQSHRQPFAMFVEEIHEYVPQTGGLSDVGEVLIRIAKRGRKRGLGMVGLSQRPADVKKDFITQCDWMVWHRLTWDNDTKVVRRVVGSDYESAVQELGDGEAFLMADWEQDIIRVQFRRKHTFDAGATPGLGDVEQPELKSVSGDLIDELQSISEDVERRRDRIEQLEATIDRKDEQIQELEQRLENQEDIANAARQMADALTSDDGESVSPEIIEEKNERITTLESDLEDRDETIQQLRGRVDELERELNQRPDISERAFEAVSVLAEEFDIGAADDERLRRKLRAAQERITELEERAGAVTAPDEYDEFIEDDDVRDAIEAAKEEATARKYVKAVVSRILRNGGATTATEVAGDIDVRPKDISSAMLRLEEQDVVVTSGAGADREADFDFDSIRELKERQARQRRAEKHMEKL